MSKLVLNEASLRRIVKKINETHDYWREAEDNYLMRERLPKGWVKREDGNYEDPDGNLYQKDDYGRNFIPLNEVRSGSKIPEDVRNDFINWAMNEAGRERRIGGPVNALGLMYDYYNEDDDSALYELVEKYKESRGIVTEPDSQDDVWIAEEIRRAVNDWGYYNAQNMEEPEDEDMDECGSMPLNEAYGIGYQGRFLKLGGWGPTFTSFPEDAEKFDTPQEAKAYIQKNLPNFGASVVSLPGADDDDLYEGLKKRIKGLIRESIYNMGGIQSFMPQRQAPVDMMERGHEEHHEEARPAKHTKGNGEKKTTKRSIVIKWLKDPATNCAEIMRQLWNPSPEEEDTKRGEFYKKRDGAINKDSGARYSFSDDEINALYRIKSNRS